MRPLALLVVAIFATTVFAGCTEPAEDDKDAPTTGAGAGSGATASSTPGPGSSSAPPANREPRITLAASIAQGPAPLKVNFTLSGDDPDGDDIDWTFDANGDDTNEIDGTGFPFTFEYIFEVGGQYGARLSATDGTHSVTDVVNITVTPGAGAAVPDPITITGTATGLWAGIYVGDPTVHTFPLNVVVNNFTANITWPQQTIDLDWQILTPDGDLAGRRNEINIPINTPVYDNTESEIIVTSPTHLGQLGDWTIEVIGAMAVDSPYTITITFA